MRIAIVDVFGSALSWALRLQDEGHDVAVWTVPKEMRHVGDGLVQKAGGWGPLLGWAKIGLATYIDTIVLFTGSGNGDKAEEARELGLVVVGGGKFPDRLEKDRAFGFRVIEDAGGKTPPYETFESFRAALDRAHNIDQFPVYFKSDRYLDSDATHCADSAEELIEYLEFVIRKYGGHGRCMLQQKIEGVPLSTARWWNGKSFVGPYEFTIEHKKFLNDELGPATGCSFNAVWFQNESAVPTPRGFDTLVPAFTRAQAPPGLYDVNSVIAADGTPYFLEWTPRLGYDSEMTSGRLFPELGALLHTVGYGVGTPSPAADLAWSVRLSVPPYPWEHLDKNASKSCEGVQIKGDHGDCWSESFIGYSLKAGPDGLEVGGPDGIVGLAYAQGAPLSKMGEQTIEFAKKGLRVPGLQLRTDGHKLVAEDAAKIKKAGHDVHPDLMR